MCEIGTNVSLRFRKYIVRLGEWVGIQREIRFKKIENLTWNLDIKLIRLAESFN